MSAPEEWRVLFQTGVRVRLYDGSGRLLVTNNRNYGPDSPYATYREVPAGTYYVAVSSYTDSDYPHLKPTGRYELLIGYSSTGDDDHSNSPIASTATPVRLNSQVAGIVGDGDDGDPGDRDCFRLDVVQSGTLTIYATSEIGVRGNLLIPGQRNWYFNGMSRIEWDSFSYDGRNFHIQREIEPGTFLVCIEWSRASNTTPLETTILYTFHIEFSATDTPDTPDELPIGWGDRRATLLNLSPWQAWVHLYCQKDRPASDADPVAPCRVTFECNGMQGEPVAWTVDVASKTIFSYWPDKTAPDGTSANLEAVLIDAGKTREEARRRTTCEVFSLDPIAVRGYTRFGSDVLVPVAVYD